MTLGNMRANGVRLLEVRINVTKFKLADKRAALVDLGRPCQ
jgi:hypothetical protein